MSDHTRQEFSDQEEKAPVIDVVRKVCCATRIQAVVVIAGSSSCANSDCD